RYLGTWNQVASIPAWFDLFCLRDTQARYTLNGDQTVKVFNTCSGPFDFTVPIEGRARVADPVTNGALQVSFLSLFGFQLYFGGTNYVIAAHDADYTWALVGSPDRGTGFLLSRSPALTPQQWQTARNAVTAAGFDSCRFNTTITTGGLTTRQPLCTLNTAS
ncbi:MAG: lipocalin family protein, partial [Mycobacteriaceae bacterium]